MVKRFKLTKNMDLIEIYEEGKFDIFKEKYIEFEKGLKEFEKLYEDIINKYYPEFIEENLESYYKGPKLRVDLFKDPLVNKFIKLSNNYLEDRSINFQEFIPKDQNGKLFYETYLKKRFKHIYYKTIREDVSSLGYLEVIDFIDKHPVDRWDLRFNYLDRLQEKLKLIRKESGLTLEEFAEKLNLTDNELFRIENNNYISKDIIEKYASYESITCKELLEFDYLINLFEFDLDEDNSYLRLKFDDSLEEFKSKIN